jgi:hypothetical protein
LMVLILAIPVSLLLTAIFIAMAWKMRFPTYGIDDFWEGLRVAGVCILAFVHVTLATAAISAIIMGIGEGISYWRSSRKTEPPTVS